MGVVPVQNLESGQASGRETRRGGTTSSSLSLSFLLVTRLLSNGNSTTHSTTTTCCYHTTTLRVRRSQCRGGSSSTRRLVMLRSPRTSLITVKSTLITAGLRSKTYFSRRTNLRIRSIPSFSTSSPRTASDPRPSTHQRQFKRYVVRSFGQAR